MHDYTDYDKPDYWLKAKQFLSNLEKRAVTKEGAFGPPPAQHVCPITNATFQNVGARLTELLPPAATLQQQEEFFKLSPEKQAKHVDTAHGIANFVSSNGGPKKGGGSAAR